ncbi:MAG: hypothetical protein ACLQMG_05670 [Terracidiphilus sp.]|jgi:hypothetical protein
MCIEVVEAGVKGERAIDFQQRLGILVSLFNIPKVHFADARLAAGKQNYDDFLNLCVWVKDNGGMGSFYRSQHELVLVFRKGKGPHRNNIQLGQFGRNRTNVWQ